MPDQRCDASRHGSEYAYTRHGCRCTATVEAMREYWRTRPAKPYRPHGRNPDLSLVVTDVDPVAVTLVVEDGHQLALTAGERKQAANALRQRGWPVWRIAEHLNVTTRTVIRYRAA